MGHGYLKLKTDADALRLNFKLEAKKMKELMVATMSDNVEKIGSSVPMMEVSIKFFDTF